MRKIALLLTLFPLAACSTSQQQTATALAPVAITVANAIDPSAVNSVAKACPVVQAVLAIAATKASGGAANTVANSQALATASCTAAGQASLVANDNSPVTVNNSGNSASWLVGLANDASVAAGVVQTVAPIAEALLPLLL